MLKTVVDAAAVFSVGNTVACVSSNDSSAIGTTTVDSLWTTRFGWVPRNCGSALRRREVPRVSAEVVDTTEVAKVCALQSVVTGVTVSTVDCVLDGTTWAGNGNETDIDEEVRVVTAETVAATLSNAIGIEAAMWDEIVTVADVGFIVTLSAGCAKRFEAGSAVVERLE